MSITDCKSLNLTHRLTASAVSYININVYLDFKYFGNKYEYIMNMVVVCLSWNVHNDKDQNKNRWLQTKNNQISVAFLF